MRRIVIAALAVSGCTTIGEMGQHAPAASYLSARSVPALEQCLAERLSWIAQPSVIRGETDTLVTFGYRGTTDASITLRPEGPQTRVEVRSMILYPKRFRGGVEACV